VSHAYHIHIAMRKGKSLDGIQILAYLSQLTSFSLTAERPIEEISSPRGRLASIVAIIGIENKSISEKTLGPARK
jgi:hypothetical protein